MRIHPLGSRVLLKLSEAEEKTSPGGVVLPNTAKKKKVLQGEVLAVGRETEVSVKRGDVVLVPRDGGIRLEHDQHRMRIVKAADMLAVVKRSE